MTFFDVEAEMTLPGRAQLDIFIDALDIASGSFGPNRWGNLLAMFPMDAVSHRQAVWSALDRLHGAARATGIPPEPISFRLTRSETRTARSDILARLGEHCECGMTYTSG